MAKYLAHVGERNYDALQLGEDPSTGEQVVSIANSATDLLKKINISGIFGTGRKKKRQRRDQYREILKDAGVDPQRIDNWHSDEWKSGWDFEKIFEAAPSDDVAVDWINQSIPHNQPITNQYTQQLVREFKTWLKQTQSEASTETPSSSTPTATGFGSGSAVQIGLTAAGLLGLGTAGYVLYQKYKDS